jgi:hypothetical protein
MNTFIINLLLIRLILILIRILRFILILLLIIIVIHTHAHKASTEDFATIRKRVGGEAETAQTIATACLAISSGFVLAGVACWS